MRTVSMDMDEYNEDLFEHHYSGHCCGVSSVMHFLESGKDFEDWFYESHDQTERIPENWKRILKALNKPIKQ